MLTNGFDKMENYWRYKLALEMFRVSSKEKHSEVLHGPHFEKPYGNDTQRNEENRVG